MDSQQQLFFVAIVAISITLVALIYSVGNLFSRVNKLEDKIK